MPRAKPTAKKCSWCAAAAVPGRSLCAQHGEVAAARAKERSAEGKCKECSSLALPGKTRCAGCSAKRRRAYDQARINGTCTRCGEPAGASALCATCTDQRIEQTAARSRARRVRAEESA
jgi:hypothetical protein